jgi:DNA adenine methylase
MEHIDAVAGEVLQHVFSFEPSTKPFAYTGGDYYFFPTLLRVFQRSRANAFVEVFGGSCYSSLNVPRSKFKVIICNDADRLLIQLFQLIKDDPAGLAKRLALLPVSRELHAIARDVLEDPRVDTVTKTVMLFYIIRTSWSGSPSGGFRVSHTRSIARIYTRGVAAIADYAVKARDVVFECMDFEDILKRYDSPSTLFYLDPPYVSQGEKNRENLYRLGFTNSRLTQMANALKNVRGDWVLKIAEDNYKLIQSVLPEHDTEQVDMLNATPRSEGGHEKMRYIITYRIGARRDHGGDPAQASILDYLQEL